MRHSCISLGYTNKDCCYFAYYDKGKKEYIPLSWVGARKKVYFPEYAKLVYKTPSFQYLKGLVDSGKKLALVDFDGYNYNEECGMKKKYEQYINKCKKANVEPTISEQDFLSIDSMKKAVDCLFLPCGHGFVIKALLQGDIEVVNGEIIDKGGVLE